jgi:hypothetical protein
MLVYFPENRNFVQIITGFKKNKNYNVNFELLDRYLCMIGMTATPNSPQQPVNKINKSKSSHFLKEYRYGITSHGFRIQDSNPDANCLVRIRIHIKWVRGRVTL